VPSACHIDRARAVPSGQPRTTPQRPRPARFLQSRLTNWADLALQAGGRRELSRPSIRTTLRAFWRLFKVVCWQSAGTRLWKETQEPVCAGGRDRFRTCGLCRVRERGPHTHQFGTPRRTISVQVNEPAEPRPRGAACGITRYSFWQIPGKPCRKRQRHRVGPRALPGNRPHRGAQGEVGRGNAIELVPRHRERHRHTRPNTWAVGRHHRRPIGPGGIDEHLATALIPDVRGCRQLGVEQLGACGDRPRRCRSAASPPSGSRPRCRRPSRSRPRSLAWWRTWNGSRRSPRWCSPCRRN